MSIEEDKNNKKTLCLNSCKKNKINKYAPKTTI